MTERAPWFAALGWLDPCPVWVKVYVVAAAVIGVWVLWRIFGPRGSAWSPNPGYCFKQAGFYLVGRTKDRGLLVLERIGRSVLGLHCDCRADDWTEGDEGAIRCVQCGGYAGEPGTSIRVVEVANA